MKPLSDVIARQKRGEAAGIYSLCSAHPWVLEAAMHESKPTRAPLLIEATCNQVNQFGGYTGMRPADFRDFVQAIAERTEFPAGQVWLGGDHLGPSVWRKEPAEAAMAKADELVGEYVAAGFQKIHLDCSMACGGDPSPLPKSTIAERAARLCAVAERKAKEAGAEPPVYVIGTEVPVPGGAAEALHELAVTTPQAAEATLKTHRRAFDEAGVGAAWRRVVALVVQPGVEFDHHHVVDYVPKKAKALSAFIERDPQFVYEAHSTDYQTPRALAELVRDHFAILKVGPAATFAMRETLWALAAIESELPGIEHRSNLREVVLRVMRADPQHWRGHHAGDTPEAIDLAFGLSDRVRYYWPHPDVQQACTALLSNLRGQTVPLTLVSQFLPRQFDAIRAGRLDAAVDAVLGDGIAAALRPYLEACAA